MIYSFFFLYNFIVILKKECYTFIERGVFMTTAKIKEAILQLTKEYPISKVILFGSRAAGTNSENSDIDLIMEFSKPISLLTISAITCQLEEMLSLDVDIIHGPIRSDDIIEVHDEVLLYDVA